MQNSRSNRRHLKLVGCNNLREFGGYTTSTGKQTRWGMCLRSDRLDRLPTDSQQQLIDYGVRTIIDLRNPPEIDRENYGLSNREEITYFNLPIAENQDNKDIAAIRNKSLLEHNYFFLDERSQILQKILTTIATQQTAVVIHCAAGKDRTGIISALLLAIADVPITTIAEDYQLSDIYLAPWYAEIRPRAIAENFTHLLESPPQTVIDTFTYLDCNYGGVNKYLDNIGIDAVTRDYLKNMLVEEIE